MKIAFLIGGLALFLYGMQMTSRELKGLSGRRVKISLALLSNSRIMGVLLGMVITVMLNSSSAATVMLVGLTASGVINFRQAVSIVLGATIGTTIIVQIIAFDLTSSSLVILTVGFLLTFVKRRNIDRIGAMLMGIGLIFFAMWVMKYSMRDISGSYFDTYVRKFFGNHYLGLLASALFTAVIQSSAATIAMIKPLLGKSLSLESAVPIIFGANIGTTITALLACIVSNRAGKRVALVHLFVKIVGVVIFFPFIPFLARLSAYLTSALGSAGPAHAVANAHTLFNLFNVIIFLPFVPLVARLFEKLVPPVQDEGARIVKIERDMLKSPPQALSRSTEAVREMADRTLGMLRRVASGFEEENEDKLESVIREDDLIDLYEDVLTDFLTALKDSKLDSDELMRRDKLLYILKKIEVVGDILSKEITPLLLNKVRNQLDFTIEGSMALGRFCSRIVSDFEAATAAINDFSGEKAASVAEFEKEIDTITKDMHLAHLKRVKGGLLEAKGISAIYLDIIHNLRFVHFHLADIVKTLTEKTED